MAEKKTQNSKGTREQKVGRRHSIYSTSNKKLDDELTLVEKERGIQSMYSQKKVSKQNKSDKRNNQPKSKAMSKARLAPRIKAGMPERKK